MSTVQEIKAAIDQLPLEQKANLVSELCGWSDDDWDRRMKTDARAGKFIPLNEAARVAHRTGRTEPLSGEVDRP